MAAPLRDNPTTDAPEPGKLPPKLREMLEGVTLKMTVRSGTRVDTGRWGHRPRIWAACTPDEVLLYADGPAPLLKSIEHGELTGSFYNHVTAQLVLAGEDHEPIQNLKLRPEPAYQLLGYLGCQPPKPLETAGHNDAGHEVKTNHA